MESGKNSLGPSIKKRERAFTLIEMLVVMTIVALLLTLALPRYFSSLDRSKVTVLQENLRIIRVSLDRFYADKGHYPESLEELVEKKYLRSVPFDPITESNKNWIAVSPSDTEQRGIADVKSGATGQSPDGKSYDSM